MPILLIEDEPRILAFLRRGLEAQGYAVDWAADGVEGLRRIRAHRYDLVVLDLLLPKLDGFAVLRELRSSAPGLPVLILSARSDLQTKLRGFELGARDYMAKPFSLEELLARIRVQLCALREGLEERSIVRSGPLELDLTGRRARLGELVCDLTDREFRMLHLLVRHDNATARALYDGAGYHAEPRVVMSKPLG